MRECKNQSFFHANFFSSAKKKCRGAQNILNGNTLTLRFIFQNHNFFRFSWHIIELVCRMVTIFLPTQRSRLSEPPRYLKRVRKGYRKFSRHIWEKSFCSKYEVLSKYSNLTLSFIYIFRAETFFSNVSRKFSGTFTNTFNVSGRFA